MGKSERLKVLLLLMKSAWRGTQWEIVPLMKALEVLMDGRQLNRMDWREQMRLVMWFVTRMVVRMETGTRTREGTMGVKR